MRCSHLQLFNPKETIHNLDLVSLSTTNNGAAYVDCVVTGIFNIRKHCGSFLGLGFMVTFLIFSLPLTHIWCFSLLRMQLSLQRANSKLLKNKRGGQSLKAGQPNDTGFFIRLRILPRFDSTFRHLIGGLHTTTHLKKTDWGGFIGTIQMFDRWDLNGAILGCTHT